MKQGGFIPVIILAAVVILAGVGGTAYYVHSSRQPKTEPVFQQQENQYENWQEYVNPKYNYTVKYPPDWFFHKTGLNPPPPASIKLSSVEEKPDLAGNEINVQILSLPASGETLESNAEIQSLTGQGHGKKTITISGEPAIKLEKADPEGGVESSIYVYHNGNVYRLVWNLWNSEIKRLYEGTLQEIINSFSFTD
ncbi:hypothetical protein KKE78_01215 [Patescibacteria group bacterium]|nr:hypothetical protein [Patescibacteria group bacterium]